MIVLGLHKDPWHNAGAAVIKAEGSVVRFANLAEERCDRVKDSRAFPSRSTRACLDELDVGSVRDVDLVVLDHIVHPNWRYDFHRQPCTRETFLNELDPARIHVIDHHHAHAHIAFYSSRFDEAAVLIVDGRGSDKETQSLFKASVATGIQRLDVTDRVGVGLLYSAVTQRIGFGLLQEGKTMGLAPYGANVPKRIFRFPNTFDGIVTDYGAACIEGSYEMRGEIAPIQTFEDKARAAFEVQEETERALLHLARYAKERTGAKNLCLSGGVALNSVANYQILCSGLFDDVFINPAASDTGIPLGAALYGYHTILGQKKHYGEISPYLGPRYSSQRIARAIASFQGYRVVSDSAFAHAARYLVDNRIIGFFQGRSEMGPRALGNRSILMSPLVAENKDVLNARVKFREAFRPFAPAILEEHTKEYYLLDRPSPYMLLVPKVRPEKRAIIPAVTHVDDTGRLQTVSRHDAPHFYSIIEAFHRATGIPILLNTSFNVAGEPIVETPEDAIRCFLGTDLDALLIGDHLLIKTGRELSV